MRYFPQTDQDRARMLKTIGTGTVDDLFAAIPGPLRLDRDLDLDEPMGEIELERHLNNLAAVDCVSMPVFKGGGIYEPEAHKFMLKCDACFRKDPVLRNFQDCEVYSRVVGYLRPVAQWNDAKQEEFDDRKLFDESIRG